MTSRLDDHQHRHGNENDDDVVGDHTEIERQADRHEKQTQQDAAEWLDVGFEFVPVGGFGQHHACDKGTQCHRQAGKLHQGA